jgi:hypothetical protein
MKLFLLVVVALAAARLTRLTITDTITAPARRVVLTRVLYSRPQRRALAAKANVPPPTRRWAAGIRQWLHSLLTCDWCVGVWWCAVVVLLGRVFGCSPWYRIPVLILAAAYVLGWLAEHENPAADPD